MIHFLLYSSQFSGTDHAWSGISLVAGGSVNGGKIFGDYPNDLTSESPLDIGRGRLIPTMPFDSIWNGVSQWLGVSDDYELSKILPNRKSFSDLLFSNHDLFIEANSRNHMQCENEGEEISCLATESKGIIEDDLFTNDQHDDNYYDDFTNDQHDNYYDDYTNEYYGSDASDKTATDEKKKKPISVSTFLTLLTFLILCLGVYVNFYYIKSSQHINTKGKGDETFDSQCEDICVSNSSIEISTKDQSSKEVQKV